MSGTQPPATRLDPGPDPLTPEAYAAAMPRYDGSPSGAPATERRSAYGIAARLSNEQIAEVVRENAHLRRELEQAGKLNEEAHAAAAAAERERDDARAALRAAMAGEVARDA